MLVVRLTEVLHGTLLCRTVVQSPGACVARLVAADAVDAHGAPQHRLLRGGELRLQHTRNDRRRVCHLLAPAQVARQAWIRCSRKVGDMSSIQANMRWSTSPPGPAPYILTRLGAEPAPHRTHSAAWAAGPPAPAAAQSGCSPACASLNVQIAGQQLGGLTLDRRPWSSFRCLTALHCC